MYSGITTKITYAYIFQEKELIIQVNVKKQIAKEWSLRYT